MLYACALVYCACMDRTDMYMSLVLHRAQQQRSTAPSTNVMHSPGKSEQVTHLNNRMLQLEDQLEHSLDKEKQLDAQVNMHSTLV